MRLAYWRSLTYYNSRRMNEPENAQRTIIGFCSWCSHAYTCEYAYECLERHRYSYPLSIYSGCIYSVREINLVTFYDRLSLEMNLVFWYKIEIIYHVDGHLCLKSNSRWLIFDGNYNFIYLAFYKKKNHASSCYKITNLLIFFRVDLLHMSLFEILLFFTSFCIVMIL